MASIAIEFPVTINRAMPNKLLLTSFQTWLPHQKSNSSDDLLEAMARSVDLDRFTLLRKLPVDTKTAAERVIEKIKAIQPKGVVCCGMAESRSQLTVESNATCDRDCRFTRLDLTELITRTSNTKISHDAGKFVCEGLYYQILSYLETNNLDIFCVFVHVPRFEIDNLEAIERDFRAIINFIDAKV